MNRRIHTAIGLSIGLVALLAASTLQAGTISYLPITGDADSDISTAKLYTHVLDFGTHDPGAKVNDVHFRQTLKNNMPWNYEHAVTQGAIADHGGNSAHNVTGGAVDLFYDMIYNSGSSGGQSATATLKGLQPGQQYDTRFYVRRWGAGAREATITFDTNGDAVAEDQVVIDEDDASKNPPDLGTADRAYALSYQFTADSPELAVEFTYAGAPSWHFYGLSNELVGSRSGLVNGSFEADTFIDDPANSNVGYISSPGSSTIFGWFASENRRVGQNPTSSGYGPFANNGTVPDGQQVALLQRRDETEPVTLSQTVFGFEPGENYLVTYRENARNGNNPRAVVSLGGETIVPEHAAPSVGGSNPYRYIGSEIFTASSDTNMLTIANTVDPGGDHTLLVDDVRLQPIQLAFSDTFAATANTDDIDPGAYDAPGRQGGYVGPLNYVERATPPAGATQLDHPDFPDALFMEATAGSHSQVTAGPDHNFVDLAGISGMDYVVNFEVDPANTPAGGTSGARDWGGIVVGSSDPTSWLNSHDGIGLLIRLNGEYQIFDGTGSGVPVVQQGSLADDFGIVENGYYDVRLNYFVPEFDDITPGLVAVTIEDELIASFQTRGGFANNFINLAAYSGQNTNYSAFRNLQVWSTAVPEPASLGLLLLGGFAMGVFRRRRPQTAEM